VINVNRSVPGLLSLAAVLALIGCGGGNDNPSEEAQSGTTAEAAAPAGGPTAATTPAAALAEATTPAPTLSDVKPPPATLSDVRPPAATLSDTKPPAPAQTEAPAIDRTKASISKNPPAVAPQEPSERDVKRLVTNSADEAQALQGEQKQQEAQKKQDLTSTAIQRRQDSTASLPSTLTVDPARLDLGSIATNGFANGTVRLLNSGPEPITIQDCRTSCGCTSTNCPKGRELKPGETADVQIKVTGGAKARTISKTVTFRVVDQKPVIVPVKVDVIAYVTVEPEMIDPLEVTDGKVVIKSTDDQPFRIVSMSPPVIEDFGAEAKLEHELFLDWDVWESLGRQYRLVFNVDHPESNKVTTRVRARSHRTQGSSVRERAKALKDSGVVDKPLTAPGPDAKLMIAVKYGKIEEIKRGLEKGLKQPQRDDLLNQASRYGQTEIMSLLLEAGANPQAQDQRGRTPLMSAVQSRNAEAVRILVGTNVDVNARDQRQNTALVRAAGSFGDLVMVQTLISAGADVNAADKNGMTPLIWAARWGDPQRVEALVNAGADVNARDNTGKTAMDYARSRGPSAAETVEILRPLVEGEAGSSEPPAE
jgi:ankyrin repeat protein/outer membrane biosynthesis protein TonB